MGFLSDFLTGLTDRFGPMAPLLGVGLLGMLLILMALPVVMKRKRDRFRELKDQVPKAGEDKKRALRKTEKLDKLEKFAHFLEPQKKEELSAAKLNMLRAGYTGKNAVRMFHAVQFLLAILFLIGGLIIALVSPSRRKWA
jgi:tight adherence protein C